MKYLVIAKKWDSELMKQVDYIAGEFNDMVCAMMFKKAYEEHFCTTCDIKQFHI